uniref:AP-3 complex subunit beta n=1 Tax=Kalanchoe fedtschenkoi TaxID=63787 RepID=A0A7N0V5T6_KALFE
MFSQFGATSETLSKASSMVFRIGTDAHLYDDPEDVNIAPLLDSRFDSEKCEALKRLLALIAQGCDVSNFFPQVVKNVASQSLEVKKLVYLYLLHYAEKRPNEALLSINCFQKDLGDTNPLVRAWALRTMAGIRLHVVAPIVLVAVGKCARDPSVYVRKCAANALPKLHDLRIEENASALEEMVGILLQDHSPVVVGAAAAAFTIICPKHLSLIGRNYTKLCEKLPDVEEWGQIALIGILLRYVIARHGLAKESILYLSSLAEDYASGKDTDKDEGTVETDFSLGGATSMGTDICVSEIAKMVSRCYIEGPDEYLYRLSNTNEETVTFMPEYFTSSKGNDDIKILLQCTSPLMWSQNSAVVLAAASVHWIMGPKESINKIVKPLLFLLRSSCSSQYVVLCNIQQFAKTIPSLFSPYYEDFFILTSDSHQIKALKLEILSSIATDSSISCIFQEFQDYIRDPDRRFAADTVAAIGLCAQRLPDVANLCLEGLLVLIREESQTTDLVPLEDEANVLVQAVISIKTIIQRDPTTHEKVIVLLFRSLDSIKVSAARAIIVWMVGEYGFLGELIPRTLRVMLLYLAGCFCKEAPETKLQIVNTIFKVLFQAKGEDLSTFKNIFNYVLDLAKCDINYDIRDRARIIEQLHLCNFGSWGGSEENMTCLPERFPIIEDAKQKLVEPTHCRFYLPGSLSQIVLHAAPGYESLPKPRSLVHDDFGQPAKVEDETSEDEFDDRDSVSGSSEEGSVTPYGSHHSVSDYSDETGSDREYKDSPLIQLSDGNDYMERNGDSLLSRTALESWLGEQPDLSKAEASERNLAQTTSARILMRDLTKRVKPKVYSLLNPANGNGLVVNYIFSSEISSVSPLHVRLLASFRNCASDLLTNILLIDEDSVKEDNSEAQPQALSRNITASDKNEPKLVSMEEISTLEPGQTIDKSLHIHFHHHLLPVKLILLCNDKKLPVKLWPDIGYFVKPLPMDVKDFKDKESHLRGMFEYLRRCTFTDHIKELNKDNNEDISNDKFLVICESLAIKMLSNSNISLVSAELPVSTKLDDASGLCLRFSSEILSCGSSCLISIIVEDGKCHEPLNMSVKVNCEETVFGLNLLNRIINLLVEPLPSEKQLE